MTRSAETYTSYLHGPAFMCTCIYLFTHTTYRYIHTCVYVCIHTQYQYQYIYILYYTYIYIYIYMLGKNALKMGKSPQRMIVHAILWSTYNHLCLEGRGSLGYIYIYISDLYHVIQRELFISFDKHQVCWRSFNAWQAWSLARCWTAWRVTTKPDAKVFCFKPQAMVTTNVRKRPATSEQRLLNPCWLMIIGDYTTVPNILGILVIQ